MASIAWREHARWLPAVWETKATLSSFILAQDLGFRQLEVAYDCLKSFSSFSLIVIPAMSLVFCFKIVSCLVVLRSVCGWRKWPIVSVLNAERVII